jgi:DNA-binding response OmpR family regulator
MATRILIAEDDDRAVAFIEAALKRRGLAREKAREALGLIQEKREQEKKGLFRRVFG